MLNLNNVTENIGKLIEKYNLCVNDGHYLLDGDLEELLSISNITIGKTLYKAKDWGYDEDGWLSGCNDGDYLETIELVQNEQIYLCQVFSCCCGDGLDYTLALENVSLVLDN